MIEGRTTMRLLYVDDEDDIREIAVMSLELDAANEVRSTHSGADAVEIARQWQPHAILLDYMMPEMDGPATLGLLRAQQETGHIPVVFVTAKAQAGEVARLRELGAAGVIAKPFDPMTLARTVKDLLDG
jgi:CheY-like chemotaxis protein